MTDALKQLIKHEAMYAYNFEGRRYDVGDKMGFLEASIEQALKRADLQESLMKYIISLKDNKQFKDLYERVIKNQ